MSDVRAVTATVGLLLGLAGECGAQVFLRGQGEPVGGDVVRVGADGVAVKMGEATKVVSWDRVREVHGDHGAEAAAFAGDAEKLWRARTRVERGDTSAAEMILDGLAEKARATPGPTSCVVFEGLVRCRLKRGAQLGAVWAWLDWVRARGGSIEGRGASALWIGGRFEAAPVIDEESGLVPALAPVFLREAGVDAAAASDEWARFSAGDPVSSDLATLYRAAARGEAGLLPELKSLQSTSPSVKLVADVVRARVGEDAERAEARAALAKRLEAKEIEPWVECWCRVGLGRSLVRENDSELRRQGVIQLLHAPARFVRISPALASISLAEAAVTLGELGDEVGAAALKADLLDRFAKSPGAAWSRVREIKSKSDGEKKTAAPDKAPAELPKPGGKSSMSTGRMP